MQSMYGASTWIIIKNHIALDWKMINHSTLDYHLTNFNTFFRGSDGQIKTLNLYAGRNQNHNHDLNLHTIHQIAASVFGLTAVQPLDRVHAQAKSSCMQKKLALQTKSNLARKISLLARTVSLKAGQARTARDDKVSCIQNPTITQFQAKLLKHLPNPKEKLDQFSYTAMSCEQISLCR